MNKVLDFHRLAMVLRWDALSNWKKYVRSTLGLAFVFSFICIFYQFNWRSNGYVTYKTYTWEMFLVRLCLSVSLFSFSVDQESSLT